MALSEKMRFAWELNDDFTDSHIFSANLEERNGASSLSFVDREFYGKKVD